MDEKYFKELPALSDLESKLGEFHNLWKHVI